MTRIQAQWRAGLILGIDGIVYADGAVTMASQYDVYDPNSKIRTSHWHPLCDTTLESIEKYNDDAWVAVDIYHGSFSMIHTRQTIVFGDGAMGNEGFIAATDTDNNLLWSALFDFSNPINRAHLDGDTLVCRGDGGITIRMPLAALHNITISLPEELKTRTPYDA